MRFNKPIKTKLQVNNLFVGEPIENKVFRAVNNNEAIESVSPMIYTEKKDGVKPEYDIRTDIWDKAQKTMARIAKNKIERREKAIAEEQKKVDKQAE